MDSSRYLPFGGMRVEPDEDLTDRGYTDHRHALDIKLIDMRARWQDPAIGRFLSPDTIIPNYTDPQSLNRMSYVNNRPTALQDPSGHYHIEVHYYKTYQWVYQSALNIGVGMYGLAEDVAAALATDLAHEIAGGNKWADDLTNLTNLSPIPGTNHWNCHREGRETIEESINADRLNPWRFGYNLHAVQDYFAHFGQGFIGSMLTQGLEWLEQWLLDDRFSAVGADLEALNPFSLDDRLGHAIEWGHGGHSLLELLDPDEFDPNDPWDMAMVDESQYYIWHFLLRWFAEMFNGQPATRRGVDLMPSRWQ